MKTNKQRAAEHLRELDPDAKLSIRDAAQVVAKPHPAAATRKQAIWWNYGLSEDALDKLYTNQGGACAVCDAPGHINSRKERGKPGEIQLVVDHCHRTGKIRGLVCQRCNLMVGNHTSTLLVKGAFYVRDFERKQTPEETP